MDNSAKTSVLAKCPNIPQARNWKLALQHCHLLLELVLAEEKPDWSSGKTPHFWIRVASCCSVLLDLAPLHHRHHAHGLLVLVGGRVRYHHTGCLVAENPRQVPHRPHLMRKTSSAPLKQIIMAWLSTARVPHHRLVKYCCWR